MTRTRRPIVIEHVRPAVDAGRYPVKRIAGDALTVTADIFKEGHDLLAAAIRFRPAGQTDWRSAALHPVDNDGWAGVVPSRGQHPLSLHRRGLDRRLRLLGRGDAAAPGRRPGRSHERAAGRRRDAPARARRRAGRGRGRGDPRDRAARGRVLARPPPRRPPRPRSPSGDGARPAAPDLTRHDRELEVVVDRPAAAFAAWYELFPRSQGRVPGRHGTFDDCVDRLPEIRRMGFDVVYLPPIHPIGRTARKGPDNALVAGPGDPGSPWAIGGPEGGHTAVHPELGTLEDFRRLVKATAGPGDGDRPRLRDPVLAGSPVGAGAPGVVLLSGPTAPSSTPRTRPRSTRTSTRSTSRARPGSRSGTRCWASCDSGSSRACGPSGSTIRTPSPSTSGPG